MQVIGWSLKKALEMFQRIKRFFRAGQVVSGGFQTNIKPFPDVLGDFIRVIIFSGRFGNGYRRLQEAFRAVSKGVPKELFDGVLVILWDYGTHLTRSGNPLKPAGTPLNP